MVNRKTIMILLGAMYALISCVPEAQAQDKVAPATAEVHVVITDAALRNDQELPPLQKEDVKVKQGKKVLEVNQLIPAQGENAALQLMFLIDDTLDPQSVGNNLNDIKTFISGLPASTLVGVGYMSNTTVQIAQNFTTDHELAAKAIRLPRGTTSSMDSPYLSLISLIKGWPQQKVRREVVMVSDGIDRLHGEKPQLTQMGRNDFAATYHSMPVVSQDAGAASEVSQRYNVIVYPIYSPGIGRAGRSSWDRQIGLSGLTEVAEETGGECFSLSTSNAVSFKPYFDTLQGYLNNQYYLVFNAIQDKKDKLTRISIREAEGKNFEILAPDNVWVPGPAKASK